MKSHFAFVLAAAACSALAFPSGVRAQNAPPAKFDVSVQGQILKPGHYAVSPDFTVLDAIELAGDFTPRALRSGVQVTHVNPKPGEAKTTTLDYTDVQLNNANAGFKLEPGDVIFVPADPTYGK
jgi:protein involved in polysaccharide export with SLBB domain